MTAPVPSSPDHASGSVRSITQGPIGILAHRLLLLAGVYSAVRLAFLIDHFHQFRDLPLRTLLGAFVHGLRFDASAIIYSNTLFILLSLAPAALLRRGWYQRTLFGVYAAVNGLATLIMVGDVGYYPFTGTHVTAEVLALSGEVAAQADQLLVNFAGLATFGIVLLGLLLLTYPAQRETVVTTRPWYGSTALTLVVVALTVIGARGGLQKKPLKPIHAFGSGQHDAGLLALNPVFTLLHTLGEQRLEPVAFFSDDRDIEMLLGAPFGLIGTGGGAAGSGRGAGSGGRGADSTAAPAELQNVMLLILESISNEHWGGANRERELTPFLDSLAAHGTFLTHNFANGQRSMDALPSILLGVPLLMGQSLAVSGYQGNEWQGLGHFLERAGYHTSMFHGAEKGTMYFDAIAGMAGIREFYPLERYPADLQDRDFDENWGIYDEPFLQFVADEVAGFPEPFFTTVFTISTHHPYRVPPEHATALTAGESRFDQSVRYADQSLRRFFETARKLPWYDNTLFILVGDHTPPARSQRYDTPLGRYMVPLLLYHPTRTLPAVDAARVTQHVDIFKTILDYTGVDPGRVPLFGRSVFAPVEGMAVLHANGAYWLVTQDGVLERDAAGRERLLAYDRERTGTAAAASASADQPGANQPAANRPATNRPAANRPAAERAAELSALLSASLQHYSSAMIDNSFYRRPHDTPY